MQHTGSHAFPRAWRSCWFSNLLITWNMCNPFSDLELKRAWRLVWHDCHDSTKKTGLVFFGGLSALCSSCFFFTIFSTICVNTEMFHFGMIWGSPISKETSHFVKPLHPGTVPSCTMIRPGVVKTHRLEARDIARTTSFRRPRQNGWVESTS